MSVTKSPISVAQAKELLIANATVRPDGKNTTLHASGMGKIYEQAGLTTDTVGLVHAVRDTVIAAAAELAQADLITKVDAAKKDGVSVDELKKMRGQEYVVADIGGDRYYLTGGAHEQRRNIQTGESFDIYGKVKMSAQHKQWLAGATALPKGAETVAALLA